MSRVRTATVLTLCAALAGACTAGTTPDDHGGAAPAPPDTGPTDAEGTDRTDGTTEGAPDDPTDAAPPASEDDATVDGEVLTDEDDGRTITVTVGEERSLQLDSAWSWDEPVTDPPSLVLTPVDHLVDPGYAEWLVAGTEPGAVTLTVAGTPNCDDPAACPERTVTFVVEVTG
jgi:hypothetical protein